MTKNYVRLSAQDASFLLFEGPTTPMNVGGTAIFEGSALMRRDGGVKVERIKQHLAGMLPLIPLYRQRLAYIPIERQPIWIDDDRFDLDYHVRHVALPQPGGEEELKRLSADIMSRPLDRQRPLWELWIIEGLNAGRFATVTKTHHCMIDGVSGVDVATAMMSRTRDVVARAPRPWRPRPVPNGVELLRDEVLRQVRLPVLPARTIGAAGDLLRSDFGERMTAVWSLLRAGLRGAANTPFNGPTGAHRRSDWLHLDLRDVKNVKNGLGGTINDVVLATVAGAVRKFLQRRHVSTAGLEIRVAAPVNIRAPGDRTPGNRVSVWLTALPIHERDPRRRLAKVSEMTCRLKETKHALGTAVFIQLADRTPPAIMALGTRAISRFSPYNLLVTNVPGPQFPLYMLGARVLKTYPVPPLFENQGLAVALFSYDGGLYWGFNADWDLVPDLHRFVEDIETSFDELSRIVKPTKAHGRHVGSAESHETSPRRQLRRSSGATRSFSSAARAAKR